MKRINFIATTESGNNFTYIINQEGYNNILNINNLNTNYAPSWDAVLTMFKDHIIDYWLPCINKEDGDNVSLRLTIEDFVWNALIVKHPYVNFEGATLNTMVDGD